MYVCEKIETLSSAPGLHPSQRMEKNRKSDRCIKISEIAPNSTTLAHANPWLLAGNGSAVTQLYGRLMNKN